MTAIVDTPEEAAALELPPLLVRRPLEAYLDAHGLGSGPIEAEPVGEGHSNVTYLIRRGDTELVLRRPPRPPLPPSAHDVLREARLLSAVEDADVRTPRVLRRVRRRERDRRAVLRHGARRRRRDHHRAPRRARRRGGPPPHLRGARRRARRDPRGRLGGVRAARATASRPATSTASCGASAGCGSTTRRASCRCSTTLAAWLAEHKPESGPATIVHGDYRLGNVMFAPGTPPRLERDLRLGAGHDRRPARRRRLPRRHLGAARRRRENADLRARRAHARARLPDPRGADRALRGALRAARCPTCAGT